MDFREPNPFAGDEAGQVASVAYRCAVCLVHINYP